MPSPAAGPRSSKASASDPAQAGEGTMAEAAVEGRRASKSSASDSVKAGKAAAGAEGRRPSKASASDSVKPVSSKASAETAGTTEMVLKTSSKASGSSSTHSRQPSKTSAAKEGGRSRSKATAETTERQGSKASATTEKRQGSKESKGTLQTFELTGGDGGTLAGRLSRKPNLAPDEDHPLTMKILEMESQRPARNLEAWFDSGLVIVDTEGRLPSLSEDSDEDVESEGDKYLESDGEKHESEGEKHESEGEEAQDGQAKQKRKKKKVKIETDSDHSHAAVPVRGAVPLPEGYEHDGHGLVLGAETGIRLWPVRLAMAEEGTDGAKMPQVTLYHYTHKKCFETLVKICSRYSVDGTERGHIRKLCLQQLRHDCKERASSNYVNNPNADPELSLLEPEKFASREHIVRRLFDKRDPDGMSRHGICFRDFSEYCFSISLPRACCSPVEALDTTQATLMRVNQEHALTIAAQIKPSASSDKTGRNAPTQSSDVVEQAQAAPMTLKERLLRFFCFRSQQEEPPEFWDEVDPKDAGLESFDRPTRTLDPRKKRMQDEWVRDHCKGQVKKNTHKERDAELDRREQEALDRLHKEAEEEEARREKVDKADKKKTKFSFKAVTDRRISDPILTTVFKRTVNASKKTATPPPDTSKNDYMGMFEEMQKRSVCRAAEAAKARMKARKTAKDVRKTASNESRENNVEVESELSSSEDDAI